MSATILEYVAQYYSQKLSLHGATPAGVDWNGSDSQIIRFQQLLKVCPDPSQAYSLIDYGCGYGALLDFLIAEKHDCRYFGYDCAQSMIDKAQQLHAGVAGCAFSSRIDESTRADYTVASGIFNVRGDYSNEEWLKYCLTTIAELSSLSSQAIAFNMLTKYSDAPKMRPNLYYADPCFIFDFCKREIGSKVALLHDYGLYEFTVLVRK